jgi:hypothetical protein
MDDDDEKRKKTGTYDLSFNWHCSEDVNATYI